MCWSNKLFFIIVFLLAVNSFLGGCGNKGKLTLPEKKQTPALEQTSPSGQQAATTSQEAS